MIARLRALLLRRRADAELDEELQYHLAREIERNTGKGMSADEARFAAKRAFGNVTIATQDARDALRWRWLETLRQDIHYAIRSCRRAPTFVITVVATIGLGLGLLTTAFTVFDAYVLRPLDVRGARSLYEVLMRAGDHTGRSLSWRQYESFHAQRDLVDDSFAYTFQYSRIRGTSAFGNLVSGNYFDMLGVPPALGRTITPSDAEPPRGEDVIVLSHRLWQSSFGGDSTVVGRRVLVGGIPMTVVGVARAGFGGLGSAPVDFWAPITTAARFGQPDPFGPRAAETVRLVVRARRDATNEQATHAIEGWMRAATAENQPADRIGSVLLISRATPWPPSMEVYQLFAPLALAFLLVLLIACANVANMMLARGFARQREIGIRLALGADRARLIRQLVTEAALLALPAAVFGLIVSRVTLDAAVRGIFATVPAAYADRIRFVPFDTDARLIAFIFGSALVAAIAFGLAPALQATRTDIVRASRGDFDAEMRPSRLRHGLVAAQVAVSVILLVSAGVLLGNARHMRSVDPGYRIANVLQLQVADRARSAVIERLKQDADVEMFASAHSAPLDGGWWSLGLKNGSGRSEDTNINFVSSEYFGTVGVGLVSGRTFTPEEAASRAPVVVLSEATAHRFWPDHSAIGETLELTPPSIDSALFGAFRVATVIGVVRNALPGTVARPMTLPTVYYPDRLDAHGARIVARTHGGADAVQAAVVARATAADSGAVEEAHSLASSFLLQVYPFRATYWVATAIGCIALLLTLSGVYGVVSYVVWQRRKEFGIRLALGSGSGGVVALVLRQSMRSAAIGATVGVIVALGLSKVLNGSLFIANAFDLPGYVIGVASVITACLAATYVPSRKAAAIDPVSTLRADS